MIAGHGQARTSPVWEYIRASSPRENCLEVYLCYLQSSRKHKVAVQTVYKLGRDVLVSCDCLEGTPFVIPWSGGEKRRGECTAGWTWPSTKNLTVSSCLIVMVKIFAVH